MDPYTGPYQAIIDNAELYRTKVWDVTRIYWTILYDTGLYWTILDYISMTCKVAGLPKDSMVQMQTHLILKSKSTLIKNIQEIMSYLYDILTVSMLLLK